MINREYVDAMETSKTEGMQYVLQKGLDIIRCVYGESLLMFLKDGYHVLLCFNNGVSEGKWKSEDHSFIGFISKIVGYDVSCDSLYVNTQEYFIGERSDCIYMYLDILKEGKYESIYITEKNTLSPDFKDGQEKARKIMFALQSFNIRQDTAFLMRELERTYGTNHRTKKGNKENGQ